MAKAPRPNRPVKKKKKKTAPPRPKKPAQEPELDDLDPVGQANDPEPETTGANQEAPEDVKAAGSEESSPEPVETEVQASQLPPPPEEGTGFAVGQTLKQEQPDFTQPATNDPAINKMIEEEDQRFIDTVNAAMEGKPAPTTKNDPLEPEKRLRATKSNLDKCLRNDLQAIADFGIITMVEFRTAAGYKSPQAAKLAMDRYVDQELVTQFWQAAKGRYQLTPLGETQLQRVS